MKVKIITRSLILICFIVFFSLISISIFNGRANVSEAMAGFIAPSISEINMSDGQIEPSWENIETYQNISEFGDGGYVKFANNQSHLFSLFVTSRALKWISVEFEPEASACMKNLNDGWTFYIDQGVEEVEARDVNFIGARIPSNDVQNDLLIESMFIGDLVYIEVIRLFDTEDPNGYDIVYQNGSINTVQFASKGSHLGKHVFYYLMVTSKSIGGLNGNITIPEIPQVFDLSQLKFILIGITPVGVFGFIFLHFFRRVISSPIQHEYNRIASNSFKPPTLKERWRETFSTKR